jgi:hypothetical protein
MHGVEARFVAWEAVSDTFQGKTVFEHTVGVWAPEGDPGLRVVRAGHVVSDRAPVLRRPWSEGSLWH